MLEGFESIGARSFRMRYESEVSKTPGLDPRTHVPNAARILCPLLVTCAKACLIHQPSVFVRPFLIGNCDRIEPLQYLP